MMTNQQQKIAKKTASKKPIKVRIKRRRRTDCQATPEPLFVRLHRALGPIFGGLILDFVDLVTFGPIGIFGGFLLGGAIGWWLSGIYGFRPRNQFLFSILAAAYAFIPFTAPIPIATLISAIARFQPSRRGKKPESKKEQS
jgi:hypothetical protein